MQLYLCQTSLPWVTAGVMLCALVSLGNCRWLSMVNAMNTSVAMAVDARAKMRVCFLFMCLRLRLDADSCPVLDPDDVHIDDACSHQGENRIADNLHCFLHRVSL